MAVMSSGNVEVRLRTASMERWTVPIRRWGLYLSLRIFFTNGWSMVTMLNSGSRFAAVPSSVVSVRSKTESSDGRVSL